MNPPPQTLSDRHRQVLRTAMYLVAERGLAGASLRELARRVGMSQPSLYHYFDTKDDLVAQIIEWNTADLFVLPEDMPPVTSLEEMVHASCQFILALYSLDDYVAFVRFLFVVTLESAAFTEALRSRFIEAWQVPFRRLAAPLVAAGELAEEDVIFAGHLLSSATILHMLNHRVLLREPMDPGRWQTDIAFLSETLSSGLRARAARLRQEQDHARQS